MRRKLVRIFAAGALTALLAAMALVAVVGFDPGKLTAALGWTPFEAVRVRSGLPLTRQKLETGSPVVVGFIGGSITQNAEADGFVEALRDHWQSEHHATGVRTINAGVAGTDSAWGAKRIDRDLLVEKPDLVFVEFAVNDGERVSSADMERIVRKIHHADKKTEIVFIYTTSDTAFRKLSKKKVPHAIREHEEVADHYGIPSIVFGSDLYAKIRSGRFSWEHFFHDACHPNTAGYESYNRDFIAATDQLLAAGQLGHQEFPDPIARNFELYPPKRVREANPPEAKPGESRQTANSPLDRMPTLGSEWIDDPKFESPSGSVWRLEYAALPSLPGESDPTAMEADWLPARWFEEAAGFTGQRSRVIAEKGNSSDSRLKVVSFLTGGSVEVPQVVWNPPKAGDYLIKISASKIQGHVNGRPAGAGFELFSRKAGQGMIKQAAVFAGDGESLQLQKAIRLEDREEVILRPFALGYESLEFEDFRVTADFSGSSAVP